MRPLHCFWSPTPMISPRKAVQSNQVKLTRVGSSIHLPPRSVNVTIDFLPPTPFCTFNIGQRLLFVPFPTPRQAIHFKLFTATSCVINHNYCCHALQSKQRTAAEQISLEFQVDFHKADWDQVTHWALESSSLYFAVCTKYEMVNEHIHFQKFQSYNMVQGRIKSRQWNFV